MTDLDVRNQKAVEEITGNESLLEMLETDAAVEMLEWGKAMVNTVVSETAGLDDSSAETALEPRLKAIRQSMRTIGNWAAGKYSDPGDRARLREKLLGNFQLIYGESASLPSAEQLDSVLNQTDLQPVSQQQLIVNMKELLKSSR